MGASFRYAGVDSLDMSWLPLSERCRARFESRAVCVAVFRRDQILVTGKQRQENRPKTRTRSDSDRQEMHVRSLVAVRAFVWPKLWCCVSVLGARARAPPNIRWK
jgi:hypothetical protein